MLSILETGMLTYHDPTKPTIHIMPGQVFLLAGIFAIFGHGSLGVLCAKLVMITFGVLSIYMTYKIGTYILNPAVGLIAALLLSLYPPSSSRELDVRKSVSISIISYYIGA